MKILIITNKIDIHADLVIEKLHQQKHPFVRLNTEDFPQQIELTFDNRKDDIRVHCRDSNQVFYAKEIKSVWYRRPERPQISSEIEDAAYRKFARRESEAALQGLYGLIDATWINHPLANRHARSKIKQLQVAKQLGFVVPKTIVTNSPREAKNFLDQLDSGAVVKTLSWPTVERDENRFFTIWTSPIHRQDQQNLDSIKYAPTLLQEYISKKVEIRVTIFGDLIYSTEIHSQQHPATRHDWRHYGVDVAYRPHKLPSCIEQKCLLLLKEFNLLFGAIDLILTPGGEYVFLELNANGQWRWIEDLTGQPLTQSLVDLLVNPAKQTF